MATVDQVVEAAVSFAIVGVLAKLDEQSDIAVAEGHFELAAALDKITAQLRQEALPASFAREVVRQSRAVPEPAPLSEGASDDADMDMVGRQVLGRLYRGKPAPQTIDEVYRD